MRRLHFCWLLDPWKPNRERFLRAWRDAGWPITLWHLGNLQEPPVEGIELRNGRELIASSPIAKSFKYEADFNSHAPCADLFRYELLYQLGGAYSDIDILPRDAAPALLDGDQVLFEYDPLYTQLEIRFIAAPPRHSLLALLRSTAVERTETWLKTGGYRHRDDMVGILSRTGPKMAGDITRRWARDNDVAWKALSCDSLVYPETPENHADHFVLKWEAIEAELRSRSPNGKLPRRLKPPMKSWGPLNRRSRRR